MAAPCRRSATVVAVRGNAAKAMHGRARLRPLRRPRTTGGEAGRGGAETARERYYAAAALQALLDEDSLAAATRIAGLSERGARRLFERLAALGAIRELTGRATFRLYGL